MTNKAYVSDNNMVTLFCPHCEKSKEINVKPLLHKEGQINLTYRFKCDNCGCGHQSCGECVEADCSNGNTNIIEIERRKFFRKKVSLPGSLFDADKKQYPVRILDLSRNGLKLEIKTTKQIFKNDQHLSIQFTLDDTNKSLIEKSIVVRKTDNCIIEAEFLDSDSYDINNKKIGFYLLH